jgi:hypothetical protein
VRGGGNVVAQVVSLATSAILTPQYEVAVVFRTLGSGTRYGRIAGSFEVGGDFQYGAAHG